jgi:hypothetical protein
MSLTETAEIVGKILVIVTSILVIFDIYLFLNKTKGDTISNILRDWVYDRFFFITYLWGVLAGHFFLGSKNPPFDSNTYSLIIVIGIALILLIAGMAFRKRVRPIGQAVLLIFGAVIGHFFWSLQ